MKSCIVALMLWIGVAAFAQTPPATKPLDRSGEPRLREIVRDFGAMKNVVISAGTYINEGNPYLVRDGAVDFYFADQDHWRLDASTIWSDSFVAIQNKSGLLVDEMTTAPAQMMDPLPNLGAFVSVQGIRDRACLLILFLAGERRFDDIASKTAAITSKKIGDEEVIEFRNSTAGIQRLSISYGVIKSLETIGDYGDTKAPKSRNAITIKKNATFEPWIFVTSVSSGTSISDTRKKKTAGDG